MSSSIPVNLIRQWCYCPRVVYYQEMLGANVARPRWVKQGADFHEVERQLWKRRNLSRFNLQDGNIFHNLSLSCESLGMHGIVDMAIETDDAVYAIEIKLSARSKRRGDIYQLCAYAMLLEAHFNKPSNTGFLVGQGKVLFDIPIDATKRAAVTNLVSTIDAMLEKGRKPDSSASMAQCCNCEYLNHCNDR